MGEQLNPKTFHSVGPQTAFQLMNTPYPGVRCGQRYGGRHHGVLATSQAEICRVNEKQVFGMDLAGLRKQRTCRVVENYVSENCPWPFEQAGPSPPPPKMLQDGSGSSKTKTASFTHCTNPTHFEITGRESRRVPDKKKCRKSEPNKGCCDPCHRHLSSGAVPPPTPHPHTHTHTLALRLMRGNCDDAAARTCVSAVCK